MGSARLAVVCCWILVVSLAPRTAHPDLLTNGDFDVDVVPWADPFPDPETVISWVPIDATGSPASGSLQVETNTSNNSTDGPESECIPAPPGTYSFSARVFVESSVGEPASAVVLLSSYGDPTCGTLLGRAEGFNSTPDVWNEVAFDADLFEGAQAVRVRLVVGSTSDPIPDVARFDDVRLVPEPGGAGTGAAAAVVWLLYCRRHRRVLVSDVLHSATCDACRSRGRSAVEALG